VKIMNSDLSLLELDTPLRLKIASIQDLPTLPRIASQVMEMLADPSFSASALERILMQDPPLCAKVLRMANSAYFSPRYPVDNVRRATLVLGTREIQQMVLSLSVFNMFRPEAGQTTFNREEFWRHSAQTAVLAQAFLARLQTLAERPLPTEGDAVFCAGLLHDLGKIVMDQYFHEEFMRTLERAEAEFIPQLEAEMEVFGADHTVIGAWLAQSWKLPANLASGIRFHHHPELDPNHALLSVCVQIGDLFSKASNPDFSSDAAVAGIRLLPAWDLLQEVVPEMGLINLERFTFALEEEFEKANQFVGSMLE
jgi:putative nucleotidyltransferase with HDIG domain